VLDRERAALGFHSANGWDHEKQARVKQIFDSVQKRRIFGRYDTNDLFVVFVSFERVARIEAVERVEKSQLEEWKVHLADPEIWLIQTCFSGVTIFYHTEMQAQAAREADKVSAFSSEFAKIVKRYDEFGYLVEHPAQVYIDSEENFLTNYEGNWYYYYK
jgi:hypothetical protein